jgi:superfamily II DNA/RNA helicase
MGRTGRAGAHGEVISFVTAAALAHWGLIQKRQNTLQPGENKDLEVISGFEPMDTPPPAPLRQDGTGGVKGRRPSKKDKLRGL